MFRRNRVHVESSGSRRKDNKIVMGIIGFIIILVIILAI